MRYLDLRSGLNGVIIRNDNGSQFIANLIRQTFKELEAQQEFTHVATPEENAYIEAFHSIQQRKLTDRFVFSGFYDANQQNNTSKNICIGRTANVDTAYKRTHTNAKVGAGGVPLAR